jgi:hypothetical protein
MFARIEPFWSWHTPIAWTGFILFADAWIWQRRGDSPIRNDRAEIVFMTFVSVPLWIVFEEYNKYTLSNWHYVGLPESLLVRYSATLGLRDDLAGDPDQRGAGRRAPRSPRAGLPARRAGAIPLDALAWASILAGAVMLLVRSPAVAVARGAGVARLHLPARSDQRAPRRRVAARRPARGTPRRLINLLIAGLVCGLLWEFWNYWATRKWVYTVPGTADIKLFEMPLAGYLGFPAFAVECFVMYVFVRRWLWRGSWRPAAL